MSPSPFPYVPESSPSQNLLSLVSACRTVPCGQFLQDVLPTSSWYLTDKHMLQSAFVLIGSLYPNFVGGRYAVIPGIILLTLIIRFFQIEQNNLIKYFIFIFILCSLLVGLMEFKYLTPLPELLKCRI